MKILDEQMLEEVEDRREELIHLCQNLIKIPSLDRETNPPGDTVEVCNFVRNLLKLSGLDSKEVLVRVGLPNLVSHVEGIRPGPHIVLNGHFDTFGLGDRSLWAYDPFGGNLVDGRIYGRGAADMKGGDAAMIMAYLIMAEHRQEWPGSLTLTLFSDEETGAKFGAEYMVQNLPEVNGDVVLSGEPSGMRVVRFGEKGATRLTVKAHGQAGHSPYPNAGRNAIHILIDLLTELRRLAVPYKDRPEWMNDIVKKTFSEIESMYGQGSARFILETTVNTGVIHGGQKDSLIPNYAEALVDIRTPIGQTHQDIMNAIVQLLEHHQGAEVDVRHWRDPNYSDPKHPLFKIVAQSVEDITGNKPVLACMFGGTDCRFWRQMFGTPCAVYGPTPHHVGAENEYIVADDLTAVCKVHVLTMARVLRSGWSG